MANAPLIHTFTQRVRYAETDAMGIVWHGNYLLWFEVARVEALRAMGYPYARLEAEGYGLPVTEAHMRYGHAARFDDLLRIELWVEAIQSRKLRLGYRISHAESSQEFVTGYTEHVCWRGGAIAVLPRELREKFEALKHGRLAL